MFFSSLHFPIGLSPLYESSVTVPGFCVSCNFPRFKKLASPQLLLLDRPLDPGRVVRNLDVDAVLPLPAAALPEGGDAVQRPAVVLLAE